MRLFVVHMGGFTPNTWRVVSLSKPHVVRRLQNEIRQSAPDYWVLYVGIVKAHQKQERRKLIGIAKADASIVVDSIDHIDGHMIDSGCFRSNGDFRWPTGLLINEAELFSSSPLPDAPSLIGSQYSIDSRRNRGGFYKMEDLAKIEHILALPTTPAFTR